MGVKILRVHEKRGSVVAMLCKTRSQRLSQELVGNRAHIGSGRILSELKSCKNRLDINGDSHAVLHFSRLTKLSARSSASMKRVG